MRFVIWESSLDNLRVQRLATTFESIFSGEDESVCYLPVINFAHSLLTIGRKKIWKPS